MIFWSLEKLLHYFIHNNIPKLAMILIHHWRSNFKGIAKDVSSVYLTCQHNPGKTVKIGHGTVIKASNLL